ncbi:NTP/NDP exchange transporter [Methylobacterium sp. ID0610]|uniref:NTP/NDP exchange transporter n=1 Tax=Methylobacterium carpenticola TaxID=3344827 RepID=UPI0036BEAED1
MSAAADAQAIGARVPAWLRRLTDVRPAEVPALGWSWLYIFAILSSYYVMRPIRDQMGLAGGLENLPWLFTATLIGMLALNVPFGWLVRTLPRARFVPLTYRFFALNILVFAGAIAVSEGERLVWIGRVFFVWLSIFNLFVVSIFWATIVDVFDTEQGKRLFGFIAAGATLGAITGSAFTAVLARDVPTALLLIAAALLLEVAVFSMRRLARLSDALRREPGASTEAIGGGVIAGITRALTSPYLLAISLFLLLFSITSTFLYFEQAAIAKRSFPDRGAQTAFFASVDLAVNALTLGVQLFLTGRIVRRLGVGLTLAILPLVSVLGFGLLALSPTITAVVVFGVLRRAGNFAIARPVREVLFTVLPREDRYKAKSFIDTVVYRLGDQVGAWSYALAGAMGLGPTALPILAVPLSAIWLLNGLWLGRRQEALAQERETERTDEAPPARPLTRAAAPPG